jgi:hypothetical protein
MARCNVCGGPATELLFSTVCEVPGCSAYTAPKGTPVVPVVTPPTTAVCCVYGCPREAFVACGGCGATLCGEHTLIDNQDWEGQCRACRDKAHPSP